MFAIHPCDEIHTDFFRANCFTLAMHRAIAESFLIHRLDHAQYALCALRLSLRQQIQMRDFSARE
jgi:hypothetical protein